MMKIPPEYWEVTTVYTPQDDTQRRYVAEVHDPVGTVTVERESWDGECQQWEPFMTFALGYAEDVFEVIRDFHAKDVDYS